ncbi:MAG: Methyltransferase domain-containing protein [Candidatus Nitrotoga sp. LAW]|nr:MAG: Methyltransferase domain-containing protein [Candidatus Nitrotoga sp. LAW]
MSTANTLNDWFATPPGKYLLECEQALFDHSVTDIFGFNALQLGLAEHDFLRASRMPLRAIVGNETEAQVRLDMDELPFGCSSLDLVLLPHVLEFNAHPHQILREVERVLRPEGNVIISGFNPRSLWGARRMLGPRTNFPWRGDFIALSRLKDWLALLGFEVITGRFACYAPPFANPNWLNRFNFMEPAGDRWWAVWGGVYFLQAIKHVPGMNLIKPKWNERLVGKLIPATPKLNREISQCTKTESE